MFQNDGIFCKSRLWYEVRDNEGNVILKNEPEYEMAISEESADIMTMMIEKVVSSGTATAVTLDERVNVAGKTGTTTADFDRTFVGYTPYYVCGCWSGYDMNQALSDFKTSPSVIVWDKVMNKLQDKIEAKSAATGEKIKTFDYSKNLQEVTYCKDSGMLLGEACSHDPRGNRSEKGYFTMDSVPTATCDVHVLVNYDKVTGAIATDKCPKENIKQVALVRNESLLFNCQVTITDAQYTYIELPENYVYPSSTKLPVYINLYPVNRYPGYTSSSSRPANSFCVEHNALLTDMYNHWERPPEDTPIEEPNS
jgi:penicillin-binding protein 1A